MLLEITEDEASLLRRGLVLVKEELHMEDNFTHGGDDTIRLMLDDCDALHARLLRGEGD